MTEVEWLTTGMPLYMLREYPAVWSERKARLFWCACLRRAWDQLADERTRVLVGLVENSPDDAGAFASEIAFLRERLVNTPTFAHRIVYHPDYWAVGVLLDDPPDPLKALVSETAHRAALAVSHAAMYTKAYDDAEAAEKAWQCSLIREVFGNPFRAVDVSPWLTSDVLALARGIYEEKAFDRMPILADALQDAGCDSDDILNHCRAEAVHVRGCWVIDLLLGKG